MREKVNPFDYADLISETLKKGILLNTKADKFNSMVIGWGHLGVIWEKMTFCVYVRQSRYTKSQIDKNPNFTISVPLNGVVSSDINRICGTLSGRDIDKAESLTLVEAEKNGVPGTMEYPLTLECEVIYRQDQDLNCLDEGIRNRVYGEDPANFHTFYIGKIVSAYINRED